jgi:threonine synthase
MLPCLKGETDVNLVRGLRCRECGSVRDHAPIHVCEDCFGPLEVDYDYEQIKSMMTREVLEKRPMNMWRYAELLPLSHVPQNAPPVGGTPLIKADRLAKKIGVRELWIKNDAVCFPTLSFKDRVVAVALAKAVEFGFDTLACASTGNLANAVAAHAAQAGLKAFVFIPHDLEKHKILGTLVYGANVVRLQGTYDEVNRLCAEIGDKYENFGFANINLRAYYAEGSKTFTYEACEQMGWKTPDHVVVPMAGGSLVCKVQKAWRELHKLGLLEEEPKTRIHGAQPAGCSPIATAVREGSELFRPVKQPNTIARSLAIGNPADGYYAIQTIQGSGGFGATPDDGQIADAMQLLARETGIFTETAGGVTLAGAIQLIREGKIGADESVLLCITGQGLKTLDPLVERLPIPSVIQPKLSAFDDYVSDT